MEEKKRFKVYKIIMLVAIVAFITFLLTTIGMYKYLTENHNINSNQSELLSLINDNENISKHVGCD